MSSALLPVDLSAAVVGQSQPLGWTRDDVKAGGSAGLGAGQAAVRLYNESGCGLAILFANGQSDRIPAGGWGVWPVPAGSLQLVWTVEYIIPNAPVSLLLATVYAPGEIVPAVPTLGNSPIGVSGNVSTGGSGGTSFIKNDANPPATSIIESTPSDQGSSSESWNNDASGFEQILSAGVLRTVRRNTRGSATAKAAVQFGDAGDASITTLSGTASHASNVDHATLTQGAALARADQALAQIGFGVNGSAEAGINAYDQNAVLAGQNITLSYNTYFDGTVDHFITANAAYQWQVTSTGLRQRQSTNTPTAGGSVTWGAWVNLIDDNGNWLGAFPAANITGTLPASQVGSGYPPASLGSGALPSGITIPGGQVTSPVASAVTATGAGELIASGAAQAAVQANYGGTAPAHGYLAFPFGGGTLTGHEAFSGTGAGTYTHGLNVPPDFVGVTSNESNSTQTVGVDSIGSSTVHLNMPNAWPFVAVATKN